MKQNLTIYLNSVAASVAEKCLNELSEINRLAKEKLVDVELHHDKIMVWGDKRVTTKIAKKHISSPEAFCAYLRKRIMDVGV